MKIEASEARTIDVGGGLVVTDFLCGRNVYRVDWEGVVWLAPAIFSPMGDWEADEPKFVPVTLEPDTYVED